MKPFIELFLFWLLACGTLATQVETVADGVDFIQDVALDADGRLYATDVDSVIHQVDLDQSLPASLDDFLTVANPRGLTVIDDYLYFSTDGDISIARVPLNNPSAEPETLVEDLPPGTPLEFLSVGNEVYVAFVNTLDDGGIYRFDLNLPFPQQLTAVITGFPVSGLAFYDDELYFTYFNSLPIRKFDPDSGTPTPETVVPELVGPNGLTVIGDFMYVSTESTISRFNLTSLLPALEAVATDLSLPSRMAFDGESYLYFGEGNRLARLLVPLEVGITEISTLNAGIYPNPTRDLLYFQRVAVARAVIYDSLGRRVLEVTEPGDRLDLSSLLPGTYGLLLETTDGQLASTRVTKH